MLQIFKLKKNNKWADHLYFHLGTMVELPQWDLIFIKIIIYLILVQQESIDSVDNLQIIMKQWDQITIQEVLLIIFIFNLAIKKVYHLLLE